MPANTTKPRASLEQLLAEKKALDEQIAAARSKQQHLPVNALKALRQRVARRVKSGEPPEQAVDAVLADVRAALLATEQEQERQERAE